MTIPAKFKEYIWLVNTIRRARRITFAEINERWVETDMSGGVELARSTFNRHKDAIEDIFGIYIDCDRQNGYQYYIGNDYVLREDSVQNWMLSTLSVNNIISESLSLQDRILLQPVPSEGNYLRMAIEAMKKGVRIEVDYRKYDELFYVARVHDQVDVLCDLVFSRLMYPYRLEKDGETAYEDYVRDSEKEVAEYLTDREDLEALRQISARGMWQEKDLDQAADYAARTKKSEILAFLMEEKHRLFPVRKKKFE